MTDDSHQNWLDEQLRQIPLPQGLLDRLRRVVLSSDADLDAVLREVELPDNLLARLRAVVEESQLAEQLGKVPLPAGLQDNLKRIADPAHEEMEQTLRKVALPASFLERLQAIPNDEELDDRLRRVACPAGLTDRLLDAIHDDAMREVSLPVGALRGSRRRRAPLWNLAVAASLVFMIVGSYTLAVIGMIADAYRPDEPPMVVLSSPPVELTAGWADAHVLLESPPAPLLQPPTAPVSLVTAPQLSAPASRRQGPFDELLAPFHDGVHPTDDLLEIRYEILGQNPDTASDALPALATVTLPEPRGVDPPLEPGFDRRFLLTRRTSPIVNLVSPTSSGDANSANQPLRKHATPLWTRTDSFEQTAQAVALGREPDRDNLFVEDFLAAVQAPFVSTAPGNIALRAAAGPSPLHRTGAQLLQVGAVAGELAEKNSVPLSLTVAVDVSQSMQLEGRIERVRNALRQLVEKLGPRDRVSLVAFHREAHVLIEDAARPQQSEILTAIATLQPQGATNLGAGLHRAAAVALRNQPATKTQSLLAVLSDGSAPVMAVEPLQALLDEVQTAGVRFLIVDLGGSLAGDPALTQVAEMAAAPRIQATTAAELRNEIFKAAHGQAAIAAFEASLEITFNPAAVSRYRVLGHESVSLAGAAPIGSQLLRGESAGSLYEVWLRPNEVNNVATVQLTWRDPATGKSRQLRQPISRLQFAPSFDEAPLSLQLAALAAETAEVLRGSPLAGNQAGDLAAVWQLAQQVNPRLRRQPSYARLHDLLQQMTSPTSHQRGGN